MFLIATRIYSNHLTEKRCAGQGVALLQQAPARERRCAAGRQRIDEAMRDSPRGVGTNPATAPFKSDK
jgi:hypothetical protein